MNRKIILLAANTLLLTILLVNACTPTGTTSPTLENTTWVLKSYGQPENLKSVLTGIGFLWKAPEITIAFDNTTGRVSGFSGVNTYGSTYELSDDKISIPGLILTLLGGPQPLIDQEKEFLKLLHDAESYQIVNGRLQINCGQQVLIFREQK